MYKFKFYSKNIIKSLVPKLYYESILNKKLNLISKYDSYYINDRVNHYIKVNNFSIGKNYKTFSQYKKRNNISSYFYDFRSLIVFFSKNKKFYYEFGDIQHIPKIPTFVKSRPITENNANSIILNLNKIRHFRFFKDNLTFLSKKNQVVFRGACHQKHRQEFIKKYYSLPNSNFGDIRDSQKEKPEYKNFLSPQEQLQYKYILSIEGNDVATNLKWIMNSNSLCLMKKPSYETWFMESKLIPNYHYVLLKDDYSDLEEKINYYNANSEEALKIIKNANQYVNQFKNKKRELLISLLVMKKYFDLSGQ